MVAVLKQGRIVAAGPECRSRDCEDPCFLGTGQPDRVDPIEILGAVPRPTQCPASRAGERKPYGVDGTLLIEAGASGQAQRPKQVKQIRRAFRSQDNRFRWGGKQSLDPDGQFPRTDNGSIPVRIERATDDQFDDRIAEHNSGPDAPAWNDLIHVDPKSGCRTASRHAGGDGSAVPKPYGRPDDKAATCEDIGLAWLVCLVMFGTAFCSTTGRPGGERSEHASILRFWYLLTAAHR